MKIEVTLSPAEIRVLPEMDLSTVCCVVFDVLRATTTIVTAFEHGVAAIFPATDIDEALALQKNHPDALLGGERKGEKIAGFDLGNSPLEYRDLAGRVIISTTTNGTGALRACAGAREVLAAGLVNIDATAEYLRQSGAGLIRIVCAGTGKKFALEDAIGGGALISRLPEATLGDGGRTLLQLWQQAAADPFAGLLDSVNGRRLIEMGRENEVRWCAQVGVFQSVVRLQGEHLARVAD